MAKTKAAVKLTPDEVRNRIKEVKRLRFGDISQHPTNPKDHPDYQRQVFRESVAFVGFGSVPLAYESARNGGKLTWVDGNMRGDEMPDYVGEGGILDIDDEEAAFLLVTLDPIAALAQTNAERMAQTLESVSTDSDVLNSFLEEYGQAADALGEASDGSLQVQERLVSGIADELQALVQTPHVAVLATGEHPCMTMRGIKTPALMTSTAQRGTFQEDAVFDRFLRLAGR